MFVLLGQHQLLSSISVCIIGCCQHSCKVSSLCATYAHINYIAPQDTREYLQNYYLVCTSCWNCQHLWFAIFICVCHSWAATSLALPSRHIWLPCLCSSWFEPLLAELPSFTYLLTVLLLSKSLKCFPFWQCDVRFTNLLLVSVYNSMWCVFYCVLNVFIR